MCGSVPSLFEVKFHIFGISSQLWGTMPAMESWVRLVCLSYPSQRVFYIFCCRGTTCLIIKFFSEEIILYVAVDLMCPLEEVSSGSFYVTTSNQNQRICSWHIFLNSTSSCWVPQVWIPNYPSCLPISLLFCGPRFTQLPGGFLRALTEPLTSTRVGTGSAHCVLSP